MLVPYLEVWIWETGLRTDPLELIAEVIACCEPPPPKGPAHPRSATVRVLATLRQFLRRHALRSRRASIAKAGGSTLRRCLARRSATGVPAQVHALLVGMLRGNPVLILDSAGCTPNAAAR